VGWFFVALVIIGTFYFIDKKILSKDNQLQIHKYFKGQFILGPLFYLSIGIFNTIIPFCIGEILLGIVNAIILFALTISILIKIKGTPRVKQTN
jgi:hypothetical protein